MAGPSDPPPTRLSPALLDSIESEARQLMELLPHSPHPKTILAEVAALRRVARAPLPDGWHWGISGHLFLRGRGSIATVFENGRWMIFDGFKEGAGEVKGGYSANKGAAEIVVEDWFWVNGWPK